MERGRKRSSSKRLAPLANSGIFLRPETEGLRLSIVVDLMQKILRVILLFLLTRLLSQCCSFLSAIPLQPNAGPLDDRLQLTAPPKL